MDKPSASIIIPSYNSAAYLKEAVDSALAQTYANIEAIVVDDGSTDDTKEILRPYIDGGRIKYIYQANKGLAGARNTGIKAARGEYVAILDADDIFLPEKIEKQVAYLQSHPKCDVSYCDLYHFWDGEPERLFKMNYKYYSGVDVFPRLLERSFIAPVTVVFRRAVFEKFGMFDEAIRQYAEDWEFWLRLSYGGANICFLPEILAKLRLRREGNIQGLANQPKMKTTALRVLEQLNEKMGEKDRARYGMSRHLARYRLKAAAAYLLVGDKESALEFLRGRPLMHFVVGLSPASLLRSAFMWLMRARRSFLLEKL